MITREIKYCCIFFYFTRNHDLIVSAFAKQTDFLNLLHNTKATWLFHLTSGNSEDIKTILAQATENYAEFDDEINPITPTFLKKTLHKKFLHLLTKEQSVYDKNTFVHIFSVSRKYAKKQNMALHSFVL